MRFDKAELERFEVSGGERLAAMNGMARQTRADTEFAIANVRQFGEAQLGTILPLETESLPGIHLGHRVIPIERVEPYVPGTVSPAVGAGNDDCAREGGGVRRGNCVSAAERASGDGRGRHLSGADRIFRIGGAQAIAAMAYGTESVPQVDRIMGPGNAFVNEAKRQVFAPVGIDQLAGPSKTFVVADSTGDAEMIVFGKVGEIYARRRLQEAASTFLPHGGD